ncbi:MAG: AAA family ATPase [Parvibaculum sp.]|nr:AAA family ATPase [Parvibaculum sp.]|tara:strand:+ start:146 stop:1891 length:1746 start_codon:yes stop_codon:yes gene_type:complete
MIPVIKSLSVSFPPDTEGAQGLINISMQKIQGLVVVAGANGSGKTRLLNLAHRLVEENANAASNGGIQFTNSKMKMPIKVPAVTEEVAAASNATEGDHTGARELINTQATNYGVTLSRSVHIADAVLKQFLTTRNALISITDEEGLERTERWDNLKKILASTMKIEVGYDSNSRLTIDGKYVDDAFRQFSDGQKKLFKFSVTLIGNSFTDREQVVFFDEPETSLHPEAAATMIKGMQRVLSNGQLWIATHSLPLIASLGLENVWYAENGSISYGGRKAEHVINSLLGGRENLSSLRDVISEPDRIAIARFASECLNAPPTAGEAKPNDPQHLQAQEIFLKNLSSERKVNVLDWGAGRGRLKIWLDQQKKNNSINYTGYEPDKKIAEIGSKRVQIATGTNSNCITSDLTEINSLADEFAGFDFVVLANVLHEIEPKQWLSTFKTIALVLKDDGRLLILEDGLIPVGELPTISGYLLVDQLACSYLFQIKLEDVIETQVNDEKMKSRLRCFTIHKKDVKQVTKSSILNCIRSIQSTSLALTTELRRQHYQGNAGTIDFNDGHKHALYMLQYANASIALEELKP